MPSRQALSVLQKNCQEGRVACCRALVAGTFTLEAQLQGIHGNWSPPPEGSTRGLAAETKLRLRWRHPDKDLGAVRVEAASELARDGVVLELTGLKAAALNGALAKACGAVDEETGRIAVKLLLSSSGAVRKTIKVKPDNLRVAPKYDGAGVDGDEAGTVEFDYLDPASLAMELFTVGSTHCQDDFRIFDGGLLYIMGEAQIFFNAVLNFKERGSCAPPVPADARVQRWDQTVPFINMFKAQQTMMSGAISPGSTFDVSSRSQAYIASMQSARPGAGGGVPGASSLPWMNDLADDNLPRTSETIPRWWSDAVAPWDRVIKRMVDGGGVASSLPCMFFSTSAQQGGVGCARGDKKCPFQHDRFWLELDRDIRKNSRVCKACGEWGGQRCGMCEQAFMCGNCPRTVGAVNCHTCDPAAACAVPAAGSDNRYHSSGPLAAAGGQSLSASSSQMCAQCGKTEGKLSKCSMCKNTMYCGAACQKAAWPSHKKKCKELAGTRKDVKKEDKVRRNQNGDAARLLSDASGAGSVALMMAGGGQGQSMFISTVGYRPDAPSTQLPFQTVSDLPLHIQFLVSCGPLPDLDHAKAVLPQLVATGEGVLSLRCPGADFTPLEWAARKGQFDIARWLAEEPHTKGLVRVGSPVGWACYTNRVDLARMLVEHGADAAAETSSGPPLLLASENGQLLAMKFLVEECGQPITMLKGPECGILACLESARQPGTALLPGHEAAAKWARQKGAVF